MPASDPSFAPLPEDPATLKALLLAARAERDREQQRANEHAERAEAQEALAREKSAWAAEQGKRADDLYVQNLRLQLELERYKKWYYGPRADRLQSSGELAQALLNFGEELEQKPVHPEDAAAGSEPASEGRRVKRRRGRRALANFENLPVTTQVYELSGKERACPCCGEERQEIGAEKSWQIEYLPGHFERIQHVRKKYACGQCEASAQGPQMAVAARAESPIERGLAGPGLMAYIVTSKFADYLPLYRLEEIFARQGFEIARATQAVWCGDVADLVEPLYRRMAERVRAVARGGDGRHGAAHAERGQDPAGADVGVRGRRRASLQRLRLHPEPRPRRTARVSERFTGRCCWPTPTAATTAWWRATPDPCRMLVACAKEGDRCREHRAGDRPRGDRLAARVVCGRTAGQGTFRRRAFSTAPGAIGPTAGRTAAEITALEGAIAAQASHGRSRQLHLGPVDRTQCLLLRWRRPYRQQHVGTRDEAGGAQSEKLLCSSATRAAAAPPPFSPALLPPAAGTKSIPNFTSPNC